MTVNNILLGLLLTFTFIKAKSHRTDNNKPLEIKYGKEFELSLMQKCVLIDGDKKLSILFSKILEDCRCPSGVQCFWQGRVVVQLICNEKDSVRIEPVSLIDRDKAIKLNKVSDTTFFTHTKGIINLNGNKILLIEVTPYPSRGKAIDKLSYALRLKVIK